MTLTIVWNPHGFHLIDVRPNGNKFHAGHYLSHIQSAFPEIPVPYQDDRRRHFVILADNARLYCTKMAAQVLHHNSPARALHPPYSPDLALSCFWLFGHLKGVLQRNSCDEPAQLLSANHEILRRVDRETLDAVFQEWMIRLKKCIDGNGESVE
jgi:hypothetical protein